MRIKRLALTCSNIGLAVGIAVLEPGILHGIGIAGLRRVIGGIGLPFRRKSGSVVRGFGCGLRPIAVIRALAGVCRRIGGIERHLLA